MEMQSLRGIVMVLMLVVSAPLAASGLSNFRNVTIGVGGHAQIHNSSDSRVSIDADELTKARIKVEVDGETLRIHCPSPCGELQVDSIDIYMPVISRLTLLNGGKMSVKDGFSPVKTLALTIRNGGSIDASALVAQQATTEINNGGQILVSACSGLDATIRNGGNIVYRGMPTVKSDVINGGSVSRNTTSGSVMGCDVNGAPNAPATP